jgi:hypothetical protein
VLFGIIVLCSLLLVVVQWRRRAGRRAASDTLMSAPVAVGPGKARRAPSAIATTGFPGAEATEPFQRPRVGLPLWVGQLLFAVGAAALLFFFIAPIAWMAISSLQSDEALSHLPPQLANLYLDGYARIMGLDVARVVVHDPATALATTFLVILLSAPVAIRWRGSRSQQERDPCRPDLPADGARDRDGVRSSRCSSSCD